MRVVGSAFGKCIDSGGKVLIFVVRVIGVVVAVFAVALQDYISTTSSTYGRSGAKEELGLAKLIQFKGASEAPKFGRWKERQGQYALAT